MTRSTAFVLAAVCALLLAACGSRDAGSGPIVLAPSSMQEAITEAAHAYADGGHPAPVVSFAGTPALARQVLADAPADLFISADEEWMDRVEQAGKIDRASRADLAGNGMVLIAPASRAAPLALTRGGLVRALGEGPLAMADPESVPAGRYGKAALEHLGLWPLPRTGQLQRERPRGAGAGRARTGPARPRLCQRRARFGEGRSGRRPAAGQPPADPLSAGPAGRIEQSGRRRVPRLPASRPKDEPSCAPTGSPHRDRPGRARPNGRSSPCRCASASLRSC